MSRSSAVKQLAEVEPVLRDSGIRVLDGVTWGTHLSVFYETGEDLLDTVISYFRAGLENNESCLWAVSGPVSLAEARQALQDAFPKFHRFVEGGQLEILDGQEWYLDGSPFALRKSLTRLGEKLDRALERGFEGLRASGNAFWMETKQWRNFDRYERELDDSLTGRKMIVLCTYSLTDSTAINVLDVARVHQYSIARRDGAWEFLETPELRQAKAEIARLRGALDVLSGPFPGHENLTPRERIALAHIVRGSSSKETARVMGVSPRTVEFHRANIMKKLGARNAADLVRKVLQER